MDSYVLAVEKPHQQGLTPKGSRLYLLEQLIQCSIHCWGSTRCPGVVMSRGGSCYLCPFVLLLLLMADDVSTSLAAASHVVPGTSVDSSAPEGGLLDFHMEPHLQSLKRKFESIDDIDDEFLDSEVVVTQPSPSCEDLPEQPSVSCEEVPAAAVPILDGQFSAAHQAFISADPIYNKWVPYIYQPLNGLRQSRGRFVRPIRAASMFSGCSSDKKVYDLFQLPVDWMFTNDNKVGAQSFMLSHFESQAKYHVIDAMDLFTESFDCLFNIEAVPVSKLTEEKLDVLFVSTSCKPFSKAQSKRHLGTTTHSDYACQDAFWHMLSILMPLSVIYEQVFGFALAESVDDPESPLAKFLSRIATEYPCYEAVTFFAQGSLYLSLLRHRVYVILVHKAAGGRMVVNKLIDYVKVTGANFGFLFVITLATFRIPCSW